MAILSDLIIHNLPISMHYTRTTARNTSGISVFIMASPWCTKVRIVCVLDYSCGYQYSTHTHRALSSRPKMQKHYSDTQIQYFHQVCTWPNRYSTELLRCSTEILRCSTEMLRCSTEILRYSTGMLKWILKKNIWLVFVDIFILYGRYM